ncbi:hypothetical protein [Mangrovactinospora gilvigrisea]|uniref:hypothetical protein n=1 Tax=Mangrovactinospora gilvigrisea TaxID=1428644 RepID=UPI001587630B|nr:hypothetical protein [Mangrovactinospora gilvigrisea]
MREVEVASLVWLLIPLVALLGAVVWSVWAGRGRSTGDGSSLAGYERFQQAMRKGSGGE